MLTSLVGLLRASPDLQVAQGSAQLVRIEANGETHCLGNAAETFQLRGVSTFGVRHGSTQPCALVTMQIGSIACVKAEIGMSMWRR